MKHYIKYTKALLIAVIISGLVGCGGNDSSNDSDIKPSHPQKEEEIKRTDEKAEEAEKIKKTKEEAKRMVEKAAEAERIKKAKEEAKRAAEKVEEAKRIAEAERIKKAKEEAKRTAEKAEEEKRARAKHLSEATYGVYYKEKITIGTKKLFGYSSSDLPAGLDISPKTGLIFGIPLATPGEYSFDIAAIDGSGNNHKETFLLKINEFELFGYSKNNAESFYKTFQDKFYAGGKRPFKDYSITRYSDSGNGEIITIFEQESKYWHKHLDYSDFEKAVVEVASATSLSDPINTKINKTLHFVWFTNKTYPKDIEELFIKCNGEKLNDGSTKIYLYNNADKAKSSESWKKILWINDPRKLPPTIKEELKKHGIEIKSLNIITTLLKKAVTDGAINEAEEKNYNELLKLVYFYIDRSDFGSATDIARYLAVFLYGGLYTDGDYEILNMDEMEKLMIENDSFFGVERDWDTRLGNAFLASKQYGKVIKGALDISLRNAKTILSTDDAPDYIKHPYQWDMGVIFRTGPIALTIAFALNRGEEKAVMLKHCSIFQINGSNFCDSYSKNTGVLGKHYFRNNWNP